MKYPFDVTVTKSEWNEHICRPTGASFIATILAGQEKTVSLPGSRHKDERHWDGTWNCYERDKYEPDLRLLDEAKVKEYFQGKMFETSQEIIRWIENLSCVESLRGRKFLVWPKHDESFATRVIDQMKPIFELGDPANWYEITRVAIRNVRKRIEELWKMIWSARAKIATIWTIESANDHFAAIVATKVWKNRANEVIQNQEQLITSMNHVFSRLTYLRDHFDQCKDVTNGDLQRL